MLKYIPEDVALSLSDVPGHVALVIPLIGCGRCCPGCHSPHLQNPVNGFSFTVTALNNLIQSYFNKISCVCLMGGWPCADLLSFFNVIRSQRLFSAWYSGDELSQLPSQFKDQATGPDFLKCGPFIADLGGLSFPSTNQRFYHITINGMLDYTFKFHRVYKELV